MSTASRTVIATRARARRRRVLVTVLRWLPWLLLAVVAAALSSTRTIATAVFVFGAVTLAIFAWWRSRGIDTPWLIRQLDVADAGLQHSSDLLFADDHTLNPLQQLQQQRVVQHLQRHAVDVREPVPVSALLRGAAAASLAAVALWLWQPQSTPHASGGVDSAAMPPAVIATQSLQARIAIAPPAYTGVQARTVTVLDATAQADSVFTWTLRFAIPPTAARLRFIDGEVVVLEPQGDAWTAQRSLDASTLYRVEIDGAPALPDTPPHRIDIIPDAPPVLTVEAPQRTLTLLDAATRRWTLAFDATDDYALGAAQLELTLAQGSGEQVTVSARRVALRGAGDARAQRFEHAVDLAASGFAQGDDLIARIEVRDQRRPTPNITRSASFILRWPPSAGADGTGVEGLVQQAMPAYFRSQRQIIIDTEALIAQIPALDADTVVSRSDAIGADQRILRMRYGQFLGEESETQESPEHDHAADEHADDHASDDATHPPAPRTSAAESAHGHDGIAGAPPARFGDADGVIEAASHRHDLPEAATLLDPQTRALLRAALNEMWQAERELRTGKPQAALPYEHRALDYIKRVQQADRIYLARVGLELPALDLARRLTGEREPLAARADPLATRVVASQVAGDAYVALQSIANTPTGIDPAMLDALAAWLRSTPAGIDDPLDLLVDIDTLRGDATCHTCRTRLARQLWPAVPAPAAAPLPRLRSDAVGNAYLDALLPPQQEPAQ